jgi:hypothetical protein
LAPIGDEIAPAGDFSRILRGAEIRHRIQAGIERPAKEALPPHRARNGRQRDDGADPRDASRRALREPRSTPPDKSLGRSHTRQLCKLLARVRKAGNANLRYP